MLVTITGRIVVPMAGPTNTQFALAVHTLTLLAATPEPLSSAALAGSAGSNPAHVRRVLGHLRRAGLVGSRPGPNGGWHLQADPGRITLADTWRAVQGDGHVLGLHGANPDCGVGQRIQGALIELDRRAADAVSEELSHTTVAELVTETGATEFSLPVV
jgi:Rrf2 family protein